MTTTEERPTFNLADTADLMGISRSTLERALRDGCPYDQKADRDRRREWRLHIGDVMEWMLEQKREKLEAKLSARHGIPDDGSRKRAAEALKAELLAEEEQGRLINSEAVRRQLDDLFDRLRERLPEIASEATAKGRKRRADDCRRLLDTFDLGA